MLKLNEIYKAEIESVNNLGNGVTHIDGMAVFVPYAIEGDTCHIEIVKLHSSYAIARLVSVLSPSPFRTVPDCPHFYECGGCNYLNCSLEYENKTKEKSVYDALRKFGIDAETEETVCPVSENYRSKVVLYYGNGGFGYCKQGTNRVIPHKACKMNPDEFDKIAELSLKELDKSGLRALFIRKTEKSPTEYMVSPIYDKKTDIIKFSMALVNAFPSVRAVLLGVNRDKDFVFENSSSTSERHAVLTLILKDEAGALSSVISTVTKANTNILTISQALPVAGKANLLITLNISSMNCTIDQLTGTLKTLPTVRSVHLDAIE